MSQAMPITAIRTTFPDEWVAAIVTRVDEADVPMAGQVLVHSLEPEVVYAGAKTHMVQTPTARLFIFFTGDPIASGVGVMGALG